MTGAAVDRTTYERQLAIDLLRVTHQSFWDLLQHSAARFPDRPAVSMGPDAWSYRELFDRALRAAGRLQELGVRRDSRVAFLIHACPEWAVLHYALARLGAVAVPVNLAFESAEIRHVLQVSRPELVLTVDRFRGVGFADKLTRVDAGLVDGPVDVPWLPELSRVVVLPVDDRERLVEDDANAHLVFGGPEVHAAPPVLAPRGVAGASDPAYIVFTSGSTALPKPALCTAKAFLGSAAGFVHALQMTPEDRFLAMLPTFHTGGVSCNLSTPHVVGGCADLMGGFSPSLVLQTLERSRSTVTVGFDTMWSKIMEAPEFRRADVSSLRRAVLAATPSYIERLQEVWQFDLFTTSYGSTESGTLAAIGPPWVTDPDRRRTTNGIPLPGVDLIVVDPETGQPRPPGVPGEICFRGWCRVIEYVGMPEETENSIDDDGYFHSGDYGSLDEDGFLSFRGRYKMMIKTGGENVAEREVEIFLEQELGPVRFAQVVGVPDPVWGEAVVAFVELGEDVDSDALRAMAVGKIARYKIPKLFIPLSAEEFPVLANGRPDKGALRRIAGDRATGSSAPAR
jgi:fatty-acyl-CoA synthase